MAVLHLLGLGLVTRKGPERGDVLKGTSLFKPHGAGFISENFPDA